MGANIVTLETNGTSPGARAPNGLKVSAESEEPLEILIGRTATGDRVAFRAIYDQTSRIVFSIILRIVRSREVAEDVAQETFVLLWQRADRYQVSRGAPLAWITSIARYRAIDRIRSDRARGVDTAAPSLGFDFETQDKIAHSDKPCCSTPSDADASLVDTMSVRKLLKRLKPEHQRAILLAYRYGYTHEELAQSMGVPLGTAKSWVRRGLKALKDSLES
ncbi:RNA polymerase sigma factor [Pelagibius sp. Alg239-R121]|uniref:RNA polymerase sigma factor n=1 Tax=Pelagibius sp. Alg239-R121 TaxID=2993448 RepID=UPI0024A6DFBF|nr:sigma-70 family RNA polymerase sigma factor [Pelagibius sp. Alg239-R121]